MFKTLVDGTLCPFASNARWSELVAGPGVSVSDLVGQLRTLIPAADEDGKDMFVVRITEPSVLADIEQFSLFVGEVLGGVSDDPRSTGDDSVMLSYGWRYWVGESRCFVLTFAPFYAPSHPRHSPTGAAYLVFQFESSFVRSGVTSMSPFQLKKLSAAVRAKFEEHGIPYLSELTHELPEALHVVKPESGADAPVHWWRRGASAKRKGDLHDYFKVLEEPGYAVFEGSLPDRRWFERVYELYDEFVDGLTEEGADQLRQAALRWLQAEGMYDYYCGAPAGFRDRHGVLGKRNKSYLQWCRPFARSEEFARTAAARLPALAELSRLLDYLESVCSRLFRRVLTDIGARHPEYNARYDFNRPLPIIVKLLRYNRSPNQFATDPHNDKSALSLILHADDASVRWRIGRYQNCALSSMRAPFDYPSDPTQPNSSVLFAGLCLGEAGVSLPATPHFVMPVQQERYRHSIVAFLLTPDLPSAATMSTQAKYVHDIMDSVR